MAEILVDEQYVSGLKEKISMLRRKISELENQVRSAEEERDHAQFRITHELEPRIRQEKRSYDAYVSQSTGERECEWFENRIDEICFTLSDFSPFSPAVSLNRINDMNNKSIFNKK